VCSQLHLTRGPSRFRSLYDERTDILARARDGSCISLDDGLVVETIGGRRVERSTLLCGVVCVVVSSSVGDILLSVKSLGGVGRECTRGRGSGGNRAREGPAFDCRAHALSLAARRHRFSSLLVAASRLPLALRCGLVFLALPVFSEQKFNPNPLRRANLVVSIRK
jgi:hypothetical protein